MTGVEQIKESEFNSVALDVSIAEIRRLRTEVDRLRKIVTDDIKERLPLAIETAEAIAGLMATRGEDKHQDQPNPVTVSDMLDRLISQAEAAPEKAVSVGFLKYYKTFFGGEEMNNKLPSAKELFLVGWDALCAKHLDVNGDRAPIVAHANVILDFWSDCKALAGAIAKADAEPESNP